MEKEAQSKEEAPTPKSETRRTPDLANLKKQIDLLAEAVVEHSLQIAELQQALIRKRKPTLNGKVQIRDKKTGKVYPSKNNCYQSLIASRAPSLRNTCLLLSFERILGS